MCGLSGIINFKGYEKDYYLDIINNFNNDLLHRGPDNSGLWKDDNNFCYFGHTRLSIIDLQDRSNQPMVDEDNEYVLLFNGEIYNYLDLKEKLINHGIKFRTSSDTEVLLKGFKYFGKSFIQHIDGMYAFAIFDIKRKKLLLCRDRAGEKPLYYISRPNFFVFCSELKPLLRLNKKINFNISEQSLFEYLALRYVPGNKTIVNQIRKLEPGSFLEINEDNKLKVSRYFTFNVYPNEFINKERLIAYEEKILFLLKESIKRRLNSDVPLGTFLSGGIDSSITSAIITKEFNVNLNTFSIGFENYQNSEHQTALEISKQIESNHNEIILTNSEANRVFDKMGQIMDEPNSDRGFIPMYVVSKRAKEFVTVSLSGDGSDELFGGYPRHWMLQNHYSSKFKTYHAEKVFELYLEDLLSVFKISTLKKLDVKKYELLLDKFKRHYINPYRSIASSTRDLDFNSYLQCVLSKVDMASMQCSLEVRTPFLSVELIRLAQGFPNELLFNGQHTKVILRKILSRYLSNNIAALPKKGFGLPLHSLNFLNQNHKEIFSESFEILKNSNFFSTRSNYINFLKNNFNQNSNSQWCLLVLAKWIDSLNINL